MPIRTLSSDIQYYPDVIENEIQLPRVYDNITKITSGTVNRLRDAIIRIEQELGVSPSGSYSTVVARLDAIEASTGSDLAALELRVDEIESQIESLTTDLGDFKGSYDTLEDRLQSIDDAIGDPILELVASQDLDEGDLIRITNTGKIRKATCTDPDPNFARVVGSVYNSTGVLEDELARIYSTVGTLIKVRFNSPPNIIDNGSPVYLSTNNGKGSLVTPTSSGSVVFLVGILQGADGVTYTPKVVFQPNLILVND